MSSSSSRASRSDYFSIPSCRERKNSTASQCSADLDLSNDSPNMSMRRRSSRHCYSKSVGLSPPTQHDHSPDHSPGFSKTRGAFPHCLNLSGVGTGVGEEGGVLDESTDPVTPLSANSVYSPKADLVISELENLLCVTRSQLKLRDSQIRILQEEVTSKEDQLKSSDQYIKEQSAQIRSLQEDLYAKETRVMALEEQLHTQKAHLKEVEKQLQFKAEESERYQMEAAATQNELKSARIKWMDTLSGQQSPEIPKRSHNRDQSRSKLSSARTINSDSSEEIMGRGGRFQDSICDLNMDFGVCPISIYPKSPSPTFSSSSVKPPYVSKSQSQSSHIRGNSSDVIMPPSTNKRRSQRMSMAGRASSSDTFNFGRINSNQDHYETKSDTTTIHSPKEEVSKATKTLSREEELELEDDFDMSVELSKYGDGVFCYVPGYEVVSSTAPAPMSTKKANRQSAILGDNIIRYIQGTDVPSEEQVESITSLGDVTTLDADSSPVQSTMFPADSQGSSGVTAAEPAETAPTMSCRVGRTFNSPLGGAYVRRKFAGFRPTMSRSSTSAYQAPG